jgi:hypothetical protein
MISDERKRRVYGRCKTPFPLSSPRSCRGNPSSLRLWPPPPSPSPTLAAARGRGWAKPGRRWRRGSLVLSRAGGGRGSPPPGQGMAFPPRAMVATRGLGLHRQHDGVSNNLALVCLSLIWNWQEFIQQGCRLVCLACMA